jgi:hypothetical protein
MTSYCQGTSGDGWPAETRCVVFVCIDIHTHTHTHTHSVLKSLDYSYRKIQQDATVYQNLLFHIYMKLNMFRATRRCQALPDSIQQLHVQQPSIYAKREAANVVLGS